MTTRTTNPSNPPPDNQRGDFGGSSLTRDYLKEAVDYDPESGAFTWRERPITHFKNLLSMNSWNSRLAMKGAGHIDSEGYLVISIDNQNYKAHRLAFLYMVGRQPYQVDHINHARSDNRWVNLREATSADNNRNRSVSNRNTSGTVGVSIERGKWVAKIVVNYERIFLGCFDTKDEAVLARKAAEKKHGFHRNHGAADG